MQEAYIMKHLYFWLTKQVHKPYATPLFFFMICFEAICFMPVGTILGLYCLEKRERSFFFATLAVVGSIVGALAAYYLGSMLWDTAGHYLISSLKADAAFERLAKLYKTQQASAIFVATLLPIPYKLITLSAGFCRIPLLPFLFFAGLARSLRFYAIAGAFYLWAEQAQKIIDRHFYFLVLSGIVILCAIGYLLH
jgi:membrane protein YqaA with SNARE-associated domain